MSLQKGCILHASLDQESYNPSTLRFTDKSAYGNHGTSANAANFAADRMGQVNRAEVFNGSSDYVRILDGNDLYAPSTLSVFCWIKGNPQNVKAIVGHYDNALEQRGYRLVSGASAQIITLISDDGTWTVGHRKYYLSSITTLDNSWHSVGFTFNAGVLKVYIDGVEDPNPTKQIDEAITTIHNSTADVSVGATFVNTVPTNHFTGSIADVRIYNRVLTQQEITYLYESYRPKLY
jgi:hypothetical protein